MFKVLRFLNKLEKPAQFSNSTLCRIFLSVRPPPMVACEQKQFDIFFVLDGSASITQRTFHRQKRLVQMLLALISRLNPDSHIGVMQFSERNKTKVLLKIGKHESKVVLRQMEAMRYQQGRRTMLGNAINVVKSKVFQFSLCLFLFDKKLKIQRYCNIKNRFICHLLLLSFSK